MQTKYQNRYSKYTDFLQESRFASQEEVKASASKISLKEDHYEAGGIPLLVNKNEAYIDTQDHHNLILGATGSGKTRRLILVLIYILLKTSSSLIIIDVKGMLRQMTSGFAEKMGRRVITLDLKAFKHGDCWNPLAEPYRLYHAGKKDEAFAMLADFMSGLAAAQDARTNDAFWPGMAKALGNAVLQLMMECLTKCQCNVASLVELCSESSHEELKNMSQYLDYNSVTAAAFRGIYSSAEKTRQSIEVSLYEMLKMFSINESMTRMLSASTFDIHALGREKCIVYIEIADEKPTYYTIASMFIKQAYEVLVSDAKNYPGECLPVPVHMIMDEFCNIPKIENMASIITAARSRNIFCTLVVQSYHQLQRLYGDDADTIKGNCLNWFYLFSRELAMLNEISELCGDVVTPDGRVRRLISASELQRFQMGEMLVMHDRLYPYVTYMPDISEYDIEVLPPAEIKEISKKRPDIVDVRDLGREIERGIMPAPFEDEIPAVDSMDKNTGNRGVKIADGFWIGNAYEENTIEDFDNYEEEETGEEDYDEDIGDDDEYIENIEDEEEDDYEESVEDKLFDILKALQFTEEADNQET